MRITDSVLHPQANNLTFARMVLASCVIYSHCLWQVTGSDRDALAAYTGAPISNFAVDGFFFISGFLVYRSLNLKPNVKRFALARVARLWPGLCVMLLLVSVAGLTITVDAPSSYVANAATGFLLKNLTFVVPEYNLSGIYCYGELCNMNGSLWSIRWEVRCYVVLVILAWLGLASPTALLRFILPCSAAFAVIYSIPQIHALFAKSMPSSVVYNADMINRLWISFALGMAVYVLRSYLTLSWLTLAFVGLAMLFCQQVVPAAGVHLRTMFAAYVTLALSFLTVKPLGAFASKWPDYSYGMYIYAYPVMFALHRLDVVRFSQLFILNLLITVAFAACSWHFVEKPVLDLMKRRSGSADLARQARFAERQL